MGNTESNKKNDTNEFKTDHENENQTQIDPEFSQALKVLDSSFQILIEQTNQVKIKQIKLDRNKPQLHFRRNALKSKQILRQNLIYIYIINNFLRLYFIHFVQNGQFDKNYLINKMYQYSQSYHQQRKENKQNQLYNSLQLEREQVKSFIKQQEFNHQQQSQFIKEQINQQTDSIKIRIAQRRNSLQVDQEAKQIQKIVAYFNQRIQKIRDQVQNEDQLILIQQLEEEKLNKILQIQNQI